jgi:hypothetical protein
VNVTDDAVTVWLKVALGVTLTATPVAPEAGEVELTVGAGGAATVVKLQEYGAMVCPVEFVAPVTVAVYCVLYASDEEGVKVAVVPAPLSAVVPLTVAPLASLRVKDTDEDVTAWLKVTLGAALTATPVAPDVGDVEVTAGGVGPEGWKIASTQ